VGTDLNGCSNSRTITQFVSTCLPLGTGCLPVSINNLENNIGNFNLYPNPSDGSFNISLSQNAKISIFNSLGQQVLEIDLEAGDATIKTELSKGVYFYRVSFSNDQTRNGKIIIE